MSDRVILAVRFTSAGSASQVRRAVGGFLRYVQHRDLHPTQHEARPQPEVSGLLKYVAYRDRASTRAELFGPSGTLTSEDRKAFAAFVANVLDRSKPQLFRSRDGQFRDRRRAVYRLVISPERSDGLDLRQLTAAAVTRLEQDSGLTGLRWIAAVHRNTAHHHVHLVIAGMHLEADGAYRRVDITKPRLAAMKEALAHEIARERAKEDRSMPLTPIAPASKAPRSHAELRVAPMRMASTPRRQRVARHGSLITLRAVARRYRHEVEREAREEARRRGWEMVA